MSGRRGRQATVNEGSAGRAVVVLQAGDGALAIVGNVNVWCCRTRPSLSGMACAVAVALMTSLGNPASITEASCSEASALRACVRTEIIEMREEQK